MYSCKKCGHPVMYTEEKENRIGLYCDKCGAWHKWLSKKDLRSFEVYNEEAKLKLKKDKEIVDDLFQHDDEPFGPNRNNVLDINCSRIEEASSKAKDKGNIAMVELKIPLNLVQEFLEFLSQSGNTEVLKSITLK